ncbi:MAG: hypothetical protein KatS3mg105_4538 [Gemmatales bacterium]|nr:MAG: hypothetical protein KatS3mg105_4538 [Gemmatales bacterium]
MYRDVVVTAVLVVVAASSVRSEVSPRFHWRKGEVLTYRVTQKTSASESVDGKQFATQTRLQHVKQWRVVDVDAAGIATLELSLKSLKLETTTPSKTVLRFDSQDPEKSDADLARQLSQYVGVPIAVLRVDSLGQVVEVQESKFVPASRFESEPPFVVVLPKETLKKDRRWVRRYQITLPPPQGIGEKYDAVQQFDCTAIHSPMATIHFHSTVKNLPENLTERIPLLQHLPKGEAVFDTETGRLNKAHSIIDQTLENYRGEGTSYHFQSDYVEEFVGKE